MLRNPYIVHTMANTEIPEQVQEPRMIMQDNMCRQDVVIDPQIVCDNVPALLDFLKNSHNYSETENERFILFFLLAFGRVFQRTRPEDNTRWNNITWHVHTNGTDQIEATGYEDTTLDLPPNSFYFKFIERSGKQMLRVHYEGQIYLERIQDTRD